MKKVRTLLASVILALLATVAWGQSSESLSASTGDPLKSAHVYPNPAVDYINLKFDQPLAKTVTLELHSIIGNSLEVESEIIDDYEVRVRVKDLPSGYYLLDVKAPGAMHNAFKFLKR